MRILSFTLAAAMLVPAAITRGDDLDALLKDIQAVGPQAAGTPAAKEAWQTLSQADAEQLPQVLAALDGANPLAANWIRAAVETIAERELAGGGRLPADGLEKFIKDTSHNPRARRLAFELLTKVDDTAEQRLIPNMLDDPSVELRRDAVAWQMRLASSKRAEPQVIAAYERAFDAAVDDDQVRTLADTLKELGRQIDLARHYGFIQKWHLVGPFDNQDEKGYHVAQGPEGKPIDLSDRFKGSHGQGEVKWTEHVTDDPYGTVDINDALGKHKSAIAYAVTFFESDAARPIELRWKTKNAGKVFLNGKLIDAREVYHSDGAPKMDQYIAEGELKKGHNTILLKICQNDQSESWAQSWGFQLRVCDSVGAAVLSEDRLAARDTRATSR